MAVSFNSIRADVLALLNGLLSTTSTNVDSSYNAVVAGTDTTTERVSADFGNAQIADAILDTEITLIHEIALNEYHPYRVDFTGSGSVTVSGGLLPTVRNGSGTQPHFIGKFNTVRDNDTSQPMIERCLPLVMWAAENANNMFTNVPALAYNVQGDRIFFQSSGANGILMTGVCADRLTALTDNSGNMRLRDEFRPAMVSGTICHLLPKEGAWPEAWQEQMAIWNYWLESIRNCNKPVGSAIPQPH